MPEVGENVRQSDYTVKTDLKTILETTKEIVRSDESKAKLNPEAVSNPIPKIKERLTNHETADEFNNETTPILTPRDHVIVVIPQESFGRKIEPFVRDYTADVAKEFQYYSKTKGLEVGTERTEILQKIADDMTADLGIKTRVVIMNKGRDPQAFVMPDGTIFISQSLINMMDNMDEVGGVIGHEIRHLANETFKNKVLAGNPIKTFGVGWVHEMVADSGVQDLLQKANLNSTAFGDVIKKISGFERDQIHQTGAARSAQYTAQHWFKHSTTSSNPLTTVDSRLIREAAWSNDDIARDFIEKRDIEGLRKILPKLHRKDLKEIRDPLLRSKKGEKEKLDKFIDTKHQMLSTYNQLLSERLKDAGYSENERILYLISLEGPNTSWRDLNLIKSPQQLLEVVGAIDSLTDEDTRLVAAMDQLLFNGRVNDNEGASLKNHIVQSLMGAVATEMYAENFKEGPGIPVNEDILMEVLSNENLKIYGNENARIVAKLIRQTYLHIDEEINDLVDEDQIRTLLLEVKQRGIVISLTSFENAIDGWFMDLDNSNHLQSKVLIKEIAKEIFKKPEPEIETFDFEKIDEYFKDYQILANEGIDGHTQESLVKFLHEVSIYLEQTNVSEDKKLEFCRYISQKFGEINFPHNGHYSKMLDNIKHTDYAFSLPGEEEKQLDTKLRLFNLRMVTGLALFSQDSPEFYSYMGEVMNQSGIDPDQLSKMQLLNLCRDLMNGYPHTGLHQRSAGIFTDHRFSNYHIPDISVSNFEHLLNLPFIKNLVERRGELNLSLPELNEYTAKLIDGLKLREIFAKTKDDYSLFNDSLESIIAGQEVRENFNRLLDQGIPEEQYDQLYQFINLYYPKGAERDLFLREINKAFLKSPNVSLDQKTDYLIQNYDSVGPEGMVIIAEQITDMKTYAVFRGKMSDRIKEYLAGSQIVTKIAAIDVITSFFGNKFDFVFKTAQDDSAQGREQSTFLVREWLKEKFKFFNTKNQKFDINESNRIDFRSPADLMGYLQNLSLLQRVAISSKLLTDTGGAFSSLENRRLLGSLMVSSLGLKPGFISGVIQKACESGDEKLLTFPISKVIAPLLFRSIKPSSVDTQKLLGSIYYKDRFDQTGLLGTFVTPNQLDTIINSTTRQITEFGPHYQNQPNSKAAQIARESDDQYNLATDRLQQLFKEEPQQPTEESESPQQVLDPAIEAVLSGLESSGALAVRSLQTSSQLHQFEPAVSKRLSQSFDSNSGVNKLVFLDNLHDLVARDPSVNQFLSRVEINEYLGGGSLYTVRAGVYIDENGQRRDIVLKALNPNAKYFVDAFHKLASDILTKVARSRGPQENKKFANLGLTLINFSQLWCTKDIEDQTFAEDDDRFKVGLDEVTQGLGVNFFVPDRVFTHPELKSEDRVFGRTLNKVLRDETVSAETKKELVEETGRLFLAQLNGPNHTDQNGNQYKLVHSDPSVGNFVVDESQPSLTEGIIDRNMYLRLTPKDVAISNMLIKGGNDNQFVYTFIDRTLDANTSNPVKRAAITGRVWTAIVREYAKQTSIGRVNRLEMFQVLSSELEAAGAKVPLELRLMVKNITAIGELLNQHGSNWQNLTTTRAA
jgi:hypothetical protein